MIGLWMSAIVFRLLSDAATEEIARFGRYMVSQANSDSIDSPETGRILHHPESNQRRPIQFTAAQ